MDRIKLPYVARIALAHLRIFAAALIGMALVPVLPSSWSLLTRLLVGWNAAIGLYLLLSYFLIAGETPAQIRKRAAIEDEGGFAILLLTVAVVAASLFAIVVQLGVGAEEGKEPARLIFACATIVLSWFFMHTIFAVHYAHKFYGDKAGKGGGLSFPGDDKPDYWDFVYFSFVIGMTSQVSDVAVAQKSIRRIVTMHGILSFLFNVALLALTFNIAASAIQK
jgi:uncharacterized membrane protein